MKGTVINSKGWVHKKGKGLSRGVPEPDWEGSQFVFICWEMGGGGLKGCFLSRRELTIQYHQL